MLFLSNVIVAHLSSVYPPGHSYALLSFSLLLASLSCIVWFVWRWSRRSMK